MLSKRAFNVQAIKIPFQGDVVFIQKGLPELLNIHLLTCFKLEMFKYNISYTYMYMYICLYTIFEEVFSLCHK